MDVRERGEFRGPRRALPVPAALSRRVLPPLVAFLVANAALSATAIFNGRDPVDAHTWTSFDSPIYLRIADHGYEIWKCPQAELDQGATACGTVGWFPLYPALIAGLKLTGLRTVTAGVVTSLVFWLALLVVLWNGLLASAPRRQALAALALAAFAPAYLYFHAVYPLSMSAFLIVLALVCLRRERWWGAGLAGLLAVAAYPAAGVLAPVAGLWLLVVQPAPSLLERIRRIAIVSGLTVGGVLAVFAFAQATVGQWDGYFGVQARFHHGVHFPLHNFLDLTRPRTEGLGHISLFIAFQAYLTTVLVLTLAVTTWRHRREAVPFDWLLVLWGLAVWIVPLCQNDVAYYRTDALLVPIAAGFVRLRPTIVLVLAAAGAVIGAGMAIAFEQGVLV